MQIATITLAIGANIPGNWGRPQETIHQVMEELQRLGYHIVARSPIIRTKPMGLLRQPSFLNAVLKVNAPVAPAMLLRSLKQLERAAGRRPGPRWGPRCLDIDLITFGGRTVGAGASRTKPGTFVLPHPHLAERRFVLEPLVAVAPHWRHPGTGLSADQILRTLRDRRPKRQT